jgi:hypothetical protein
MGFAFDHGTTHWDPPGTFLKDLIEKSNDIYERFKSGNSGFELMFDKEPTKKFSVGFMPGGGANGYYDEHTDTTGLARALDSMLNKNRNR